MRATTQLSVAAFMAALAVGAAAQTREPGPAPQNRTIMTADAPRTPQTKHKNAEDLEFLAEAMRSALGKLELGELATQRSYDPRVRDYGERLKRDHTAQVTEIE